MIQSLFSMMMDPNNSGVRDVICANGRMYSVTLQPALRVYDLNTLTQLASTSLTNSNAAGIALIDASSAIVVSSAGTPNVEFVNLTGLNRSNITTNAGATMYAAMGQQVAANPNTKYGIATKSTTGSVTLINGNTFALSSLSPSGSVLSGQNATCVAVKDSNFLIGTTDNKVHEIDTSGTVIKSVTLPSTPQVAALTSLRAGHLSYYNNLLMVSNTAGMIYLYDWSQSTPALLDRQYGSSWELNQVQCLTPSVSGITYTLPAAATNYANYNLMEMCPMGSSIAVTNNYILSTTGSMDAICGSLDPVTGKLVMFTTQTSAGPSYLIYQTPPPTRVNVPTRIQDPVTVDVPGRIIRIRDGGIGRTLIEYDNSIGAAQTEIPATNGANYIEIALTTSPNKFDVRQFQA